MPGSGPPQTRRWRWSWAATAFCCRAQWRGPRTQSGWRLRCARQSNPATRLAGPAASRASCMPKRPPPTRVFRSWTRRLAALSPRDLAVGPLADRADRPCDPVCGPPGGRGVQGLDGRVGIGGQLERRLADGAQLATKATFPRGAELGQLRLAALLAYRGQVCEQRGHVLEVVNREAERLIALQEAIEYRAPHGAYARAASLCCHLPVQVVPGGERAELVEHARDRGRSLVENL